MVKFHSKAVPCKHCVFYCKNKKTTVKTVNFHEFWGGSRACGTGHDFLLGLRSLRKLVQWWCEIPVLQDCILTSQTNLYSIYFKAPICCMIAPRYHLALNHNQLIHFGKCFMTLCSFIYAVYVMFLLVELETLEESLPGDGRLIPKVSLSSSSSSPTSLSAHRPNMSSHPFRLLKVILAFRMW